MSGKSALGTVFRIQETTSTGLLAAGDLTNIGGPSISVDSIDVSAHDSTNAYREYAAGLIDPGEMSIEGNLSTGNGPLFLAAIDARKVLSIEVDFPPYATTGLDKYSQWGLDGIVTGLSPSAPHDGKLGFTASVKHTGKPTLSEQTVST